MANLKLKSDKSKEAAERVGMPVEEYLRLAGERGLTQREMAIELGVTRVTVFNWLNIIGAVRETKTTTEYRFPARRRTAKGRTKC
jgi:DNA invertase Pin-like site-specific DNA recombinase